MTFEAAPYFEDIARAPDGGACHWAKTEDGVRIRIGHWPLETARGTVLMFPGRTEYIEKYGPTAVDLQALSLASLAIDWRGQGLGERVHADPMAGHVGAFEDYQHDVRAAVAYAKSFGLPEPYYLLAHSMGGCIGLRAVMEGLNVETVAFSAPMWGIGLHPILRPTAWAVSWASEMVGLSHLYAPTTNAESYVATAPFEDNTLTTDRGMFEMLQEQVLKYPELQLGGPSIHWLREALIETRALAMRPAPDVPCVTFLGANERIVDTPRIINRMNAWPDGRLVMLDGCEHEVLIEGAARRKEIFQTLDSHFQPHPKEALRVSS